MDSNQTTKTARWTSYTLQGIIAVLFLMGAIMNILQTEQAVTGATDMGYPESSVLYLGIAILISTVLYIIPKTSVVGAALITAWLGGAVATHVIHQDPITNIIFPVVFGILVWFSLWLRDHKLKAVFPCKK